MSRGGARKGAGRKPGPPSSTRGVRLSDDTWLALAILAEHQQEPYTRILERLIQDEHMRMLRESLTQDRIDRERTERLDAEPVEITADDD